MLAPPSPWPRRRKSELSTTMPPTLSQVAQLWNPALCRGAPHVHHHDHRQHRHRGQPAGERSQRHQLSQVGRERHGESGAGAAPGDEEHGPAEEEGGEAAEPVADIDVESAGLRLHRAHLGVGERAEEREHPAGHPHQERERHRAAGLPHHRAGYDEDPGPDHRADGDRDQLAKPQQPRQLLVLTHHDCPAVPLPRSVTAPLPRCAAAPLTSLPRRFGAHLPRRCSPAPPSFPASSASSLTINHSTRSRSTSTPIPAPGRYRHHSRRAMVHSGETTSRSQ